MHMPREITQAFPFPENVLAQPKYTDDRLWLPEHGQAPYPLVVRITTAEDVSQEAEELNRAGYAVFSCYADQNMERDKAACAIWQEAMEQKLETLLCSHPELDAQRVFVDGWLTAFLIFHSHRFKAAIQRPALINPTTAYGNCAAGWAEPFGGSLEEMLLALAEQSVLTDVDDCKTPCLVLYREGDLRYSREQSEQLYAAMKDRNPDVPCRMAVFTSRQWEACAMQEIMNWWKRFL